MLKSELTATPAPRAPVIQRIDPTDPLVVSHNDIYATLLNQITVNNVQNNALLFLNPYGTAPLSLYIGMWSEMDEHVTITVTDVNGSTPVLTFNQTITTGKTLSGAKILRRQTVG
ncbi:aryl-sulfate sulfotransferase N-terminal domain-containing protein [Atlantibacter sp.]|uniref:aryl-sulfate sulfotransferase N-terminal domain-containing protein n=1 Tax=Atlantibacter sp. TaxID=1903473 RepID=UPI0028A715B5|nr:aryl-sulfate sulfotransferase N-terminal domain-containing protein [Atlantibacter sp.]